jgi:hypothetical protein
MTNEGQGQSPDEPHVPPASTRWSQDPAEDDGGLAPPFVPGSGSAEGRRTEASDPSHADRGPGARDALDAPGDSTPQDTMEPEAAYAELEESTVEDGSGGDTDGDDDLFPFETPWEGGEMEPEPAAAAGADDGDADRWSGGALGGAAGPGTAFPETAYGEPEEPAGGAVEEVEFEVGSGADSAAGSEPASGGAGAAAAAGGAAELAGRLETLARELRDRGPDAVRSRMDSDDRFEALLAGLLAGWLTGRG